MRAVIVIIGYNRPASLKRCYESVNRAVFPEEDTVDLYFSLDHSDQEASICSMLNTLEWTHGEKKVILHPERMGLRNHVISCGDLIGDHDLLIMLEDDIVTADGFYLYTKAAAETYDAYPGIGAISLYRHYLYPQNGRPFEPEYNGSDTFLMQVAQSWGQAWTKRMWKEFRTWYDANQTFEKPFSMADYSYSWDSRSWLRYFMGWVASENKYLVYPYHSMSTNMEDAGENRKVVDTDYQVALACGKRTFTMYAPEDCVRYDAFYERCNDSLFCFTWEGEPVLMDLNASRSDYGDHRYLVSTKRIDKKILKSYGMCMRPQENNLRYETEGNEIWLYDLRVSEKNRMPSNKERITRYAVRAVSWARLTQLGVSELGRNVQAKAKKQLKKAAERVRRG